MKISGANVRSLSVVRISEQYRVPPAAPMRFLFTELVAICFGICALKLRGMNT